MSTGARARWSWRLFGARPPELARRVGFNGLASIAPMLVTFLLAPLLLHRLGLDRFGIWSLALVAIGTLTLLDGGVSASLARFFAVHAAREDKQEAGRLLLNALIFFAFFGTALTLIAIPLAAYIVRLPHIPTALEGEAITVLRWLPALTALALMADCAAAVLQGNGRFRSLAGMMVTSSTAFAVAVVLLVQPGAHLGRLMVAAAIRFVVAIVVGLGLASSRVSIARPLALPRSVISDLWRYSSRMQISGLTGFVNSQLDALIIAGILPIRYVGLYSIGMQAASAVRSPPLYAFAPLLTRLTTIFRTQGQKGTADQFERLERVWLPSVLGYGVIGVASIGFAVPIWLGHRYVLSGVVAVVLISCYMIHVGLTGMRTCYVRAVGRPGLETRYSALWTVSNALLTVPLALAGGLLGVVGATAVTGVVASVYFVFLCRREEDLRMQTPSARWWMSAFVAGGITIAGEIAVVSTGIRGFLGLALSGLPAAIGLGVYVVGMRKVFSVAAAA
jgi:O-antigen/teichoic acid export membrane protein